MAEDCIFCKIVQGEIPSTKLYEDQKCLAILDVNPISPGHTLILSKEHYNTFLDTPPDVLMAIIQAGHQIIKAILTGMKTEGYNLIINNNRCAGQVIPHLHLHIIPRHSNDGIRFHRNPKSYPEGEMAKVAQAISQHI